MRRKKSKQAPEKVNHAVKVGEALQLRRSGASYEEIGRAMGSSASTAYRRVKFGLEKLAKLNLKEAEHTRDMELARLDFYLRSLDQRIRAGDTRAINSAVRIAERRARLQGLDAGPAGIAVTFEDAEIVIDRLLAQFEASEAPGADPSES